MRLSAPHRFSVAGVASAVEGVDTKQVGHSGPVGPTEPHACDSRATEDIRLTQSRQGGTFRICSSAASCGEPRIVPSSNLKCPQSKSCRFRGAWPVATPLMSTGGTTYLTEPSNHPNPRCNGLIFEESTALLSRPALDHRFRHRRCRIEMDDIPREYQMCRSRRLVHHTNVASDATLLHPLEA